MGSSAPSDFAFGDVVLIPFPFTSQTTTKRRPAVVVSSAGYLAARPDLILMAITSQVRPAQAFGEVWLHDWRRAGLLKPSVTKPVVATFEQRLVLRKLGALSEGDNTNVRGALLRIFDSAR